MVDIALHANDHDILIKDGDFLLIDNGFWTLLGACLTSNIFLLSNLIKS